MSAREDPPTSEPRASTPARGKGKGKQPSRDTQPLGEDPESATIRVDNGQPSARAGSTIPPVRSQRRPANKNQQVKELSEQNRQLGELLQQALARLTQETPQANKGPAVPGNTSLLGSPLNHSEIRHDSGPPSSDPYSERSDREPPRNPRNDQYARPHRHQSPAYWTPDGQNRPYRTEKRPDPPRLSDGEDPSYEAWEMEILNKLHDNADHFTDE